MRVAVYFILVTLGIVLPVGGGLVLGLLGPPPYILISEPEDSFAQGIDYSDGSRVVALNAPDQAAARQAAQTLLATVPTSARSAVLDTTRYTRSDTGHAGLVTHVETVALQVEAPDAAAVNERVAALEFLSLNPQRNPVIEAFTTHLPITLGALAVYIVLYLLFLARGASWATRIDPPRENRATKAQLREAIMEINQHDLPFKVSEDEKGRWMAEWRIADSQWAGPLHAGGLKKTHRIYLEPDERAGKVRVVETSLDVDWRASVGVARGRMSAFQGINFLSYKRGKGVGILYDSEGRWQIAEAYNYRFSVDEMKLPLIDAVTRNGWSFVPVVTFFRPIGG